MANKVGGVYIETAYRIDMNSFRQVQNSVSNISKQTANLSKGFAVLGKAAIAAFSVKAIMNFSKETINLASDLTEVQNVVDVTFGNLAEDINKFAKASIKDFGLSETAAKNYSSTIGAISKSMGFTTDDALVMGKSMTALAADMASFYNLDTDVAFNKIRSGLTGQTEPLKQLGINMSVANLEAYALSQGITKTVNTMSEQEKMILRNNYLLSVTKDAQGDFIREQQSWANQTRILSEQFNTLKATLGQIGIKFLLPIIQGFNQLFTTIQSSANALANFLGIATNSDVSITSSASLGAEAVGDIADSYEEVGKAAKKASRGVLSFDNVIPINKTPDSGSGASGGAGVDGNNLGVGLASYDFTPKAEEQNKTFGFIDKLKEKLHNLPQEIKDSFGKISESISSINLSLSEIGQGVKPSAINFGDSYINYLKTLGGSLLVLGVGAFEGTLGGIDLFLQQNKDRISKSWSSIFDNLSGGADNTSGILSTTSELIANFFKLDTTKQSIADAMASVETLVSGSGVLLTGLWSDITGGIDTIIQDNKDKFGLFFDNFSEVLSLRMKNIKDVVQGTMDSILKTYDTYIKPYIDKFSNGVSLIVGKVLDAYNKHIMPTWVRISESFNNLYHEAIKPFVDKLVGVVGRLIELVGVIWEKFVAPLIGYLIDDLLPKWNWVFETILTITGQVIGNVLDIVGGIIVALGGVLDFIIGAFTGDWERALNGLKDIFKGIFSAIGQIMLAPINTFIDAWNRIGDKIGDYSIPEWVPFVGGETFTLPRLPKPQIALKDGGIVTGRTWTELGEAGPEAVVPLKNDNYTDALAQNVANRVGRNGGNTNQPPVQLIFKDNNIFGTDLETIALLVKKALEKEDIRVGGVVYDF